VESEHPRGGDPKHPNRFSEAPGGTGQAPRKKSPTPSIGGSGSGPKLRETEQRAWTGRTSEVSKLGKQAAGKLGEEIALSYLRNHLKLGDAVALNNKAANYPVDMRGGDHVYEIKTGQASNSKSAQQWRATIGEPGDEETEELTQMTKEEKAAHNQAKAIAIMQRKQRALEEVSAEVGRQLKPKTLTMILNPDTGVTDIYLFDGFHSRIGYNSPLARENYVGSYSYQPTGTGDSRRRSASRKLSVTRSQTSDQSADRRLRGRVQKITEGVVLWVHR